MPTKYYIFCFFFAPACLYGCAPSAKNSASNLYCPDLQVSTARLLSGIDTVEMDFSNNVIVQGVDQISPVTVVDRPYLEIVEQPLPLGAPKLSWWNSERPMVTESTSRGTFELQTAGAYWGEFALVRGVVELKEVPRATFFVTSIFSKQRGLLSILVDYENSKDKGSIRYDRCEGDSAGFFHAS